MASDKIKSVTQLKAVIDYLQSEMQPFRERMGTLFLLRQQVAGIVDLHERGVLIASTFAADGHIRLARLRQAAHHKYKPRVIEGDGDEIYEVQWPTVQPADGFRFIKDALELYSTGDKLTISEDTAADAIPRLREFLERWKEILGRINNNRSEAAARVYWFSKEIEIYKNRLNKHLDIPDFAIDQRIKFESIGEAIKFLVEYEGLPLFPDGEQFPSDTVLFKHVQDILLAPPYSRYYEISGIRKAYNKLRKTEF